MQLSRTKQAEYRTNLVGMEFVGCPLDETIVRVYITGEIVEAVDFPSEQILINYTTKLPQEWKAEYPEEFRQLNPTDEEWEEYNCLESVTHSVLPTPQKDSNGKLVNHFFFSFPIDLQLIVAETASIVYQINKVKQKWPTIHFQLSSTDSWDRNVLMGCGFVEIPRKPGMHEVICQTWRPFGGVHSRVSEFFIGGSTKLKNLTSMSKSQSITDMGQPGPNNRILYHTESTGEVKFRFNIAWQSKKIQAEQRREAKSKELIERTEAIKQQGQRINRPFVNTGAGFTGRFTATDLK